MSGGTLIDGTGAPPVQNAVLVADPAGRLVCVGAAGECAEPPDARRVDASGFWIVPGLIDVDVPRAVDPDPDVAERRARLRFLFGVTTERIVYAGDPPDSLAADGSRAARRPVPRRVTGRSGSLPGLVTLDELPGEAETAGATRWADESVSRGVRLEPRLLARELRVEPYRLSVGLHRLLELPWLVDALRTGTSGDSTRSGGAATDDRAERSRRLGELERARVRVREFHAAGGAVVTGSGGALAPGLAVLAEMRALAVAGLEPGAVLAAATREAAAAIGVSDSLGTLETGKLADFVVLEGDPLADIRNMEVVSRVVKGGVLHDPAGLFEDLKDDLTDRSTAPWPRLLLGFGAMLLAVAALAWAVRRHRASLPTSWRA